MNKPSFSSLTPASKWALDHLLLGIPLVELVDAPFGWREGWDYTLPSSWEA